jgi:hypothetical protein
LGNNVDDLQNHSCMLDGAPLVLRQPLHPGKFVTIVPVCDGIKVMTAEKRRRRGNLAIRAEKTPQPSSAIQQMVDPVHQARGWASQNDFFPTMDVTK